MRSARLLIAVLVLAVSAHADGELLSAGRDTAKSNLATANRIAKGLQPDAQLWQVAAGSFIDFSGDLEECNPAVPESGWTYFYWSTTSHVDIEVMVCNGKGTAKSLGGSLKKNVFSDSEFIDTDQIARIVKDQMKREKCSTDSKNWSGRLRFETATSKLTWSVEMGCKEDFSFAGTIDGKSGKVLKSQVSMVTSED